MANEFKIEKIKSKEDLDFYTHYGDFKKAVADFYNFIPHVFQPEKNRLRWWHGLKTLEYDKYVEVGMLVSQERLAELEKPADNDKKKTTPDNSYYWVFEWDEFKERCEKKGIHLCFDSKENWENSLKEGCESNGKQRTKKARIEQLLGIDIDDKTTPVGPHKVAICTLKIKTERLFRPAYNPMINATDFEFQSGVDRYSIHWPAQSIDGVNNEYVLTTKIKDEIETWLATLQECKDYPWTRMGYTFDWGAKADDKEESKKSNEPYYIGLSEFVLMPNSEYEITGVYEFTKEPEK